MRTTQLARTKRGHSALRRRLTSAALGLFLAWAGTAGAGGLSTLTLAGAEGLSLEARVRALEDEATIRRLLEDYMGLLRSRDRGGRP